MVTKQGHCPSCIIKRNQGVQNQEPENNTPITGHNSLWGFKIWASFWIWKPSAEKRLDPQEEAWSIVKDVHCNNFPSPSPRTLCNYSGWPYAGKNENINTFFNSMADIRIHRPSIRLSIKEICRTLKEYQSSVYCLEKHRYFSAHIIMFFTLTCNICTSIIFTELVFKISF